MEEFVEIQVGDRGTIWVEVSPAEGLYPARDEDLLSQMEDAFGTAMSTIRTCAEGFVTHVSAFSEDVLPQEVSLEFGLAFKAEFGVVVTKASGKANFVVSLTWKEPVSGK
jgi:hypothetical protein